MNLSKLSQESGVPASTLKNYYQVLVDTFVGYWITPYSRRGRKRLLTTPRFLFFDVGVRNAAAEMPLDARLSDESGGILLEQFVGQELLARAGYLGRGHRVSFWRTPHGVEVDYVWEGPKEDIPLAWIFRSLEPYAPKNGLLVPKRVLLWERRIRLQAMTEGEIFVAIKDAGAFGPQAYWTYVEDPNAPRTQRAAERSPRRPRGLKNSG